MGITRYGKEKSLFKDSKVEPLDVLTMKPKQGKQFFLKEKYYKKKRSRSLPKHIIMTLR